MKIFPFIFPVVLFAAQSLAAQTTCRAPEGWIASWSAAQQVPEQQNALPYEAMQNATLRQIVHLSAGGSAVRVHLSNAFGQAPLHLRAAHVALAASPASPAIVPKTDHALTFDGQGEVTIPPGAEYLSDPVAMPVAALSNLAVSIYYNDLPAQQTGHPGSRATSYIVRGNATGAENMATTWRFEHWYVLAAVDVESRGATVVAFGDSITDGHGSTNNGNDRWPDQLARRLNVAGAVCSYGVANFGIGGNHLLTDGLGPNALARVDRDVLAPAGARWVVVLEGVNDLGGLTIHAEATAEAHEQLVQRILAAYRQIVERAHARGLKVYGATITPYTGSDYYHPGAASELDRQTINQWIRTPGHFDAVIDFDAVVCDPMHPERLQPAFDCGDHLHPSPAGYKAMAEAIPASLFAF